MPLGQRPWKHIYIFLSVTVIICEAVKKKNLVEIFMLFHICKILGSQNTVMESSLEAEANK
jgi:hypothetical protein